MRLYSEPLADKPHVVVLTKRDLLSADTPLPELDAPEAAAVLAISSAAGQGIEELSEFLWTFVSEARAAEAAEEPPAHFAEFAEDADEQGHA